MNSKGYFIMPKPTTAKKDIIAMNIYVLFIIKAILQNKIL